MESFKIFFTKNPETGIAPHQKFIYSGILVALTLTSFLIGLVYGGNKENITASAPSTLASTTYNIKGLDSKAKVKDVDFQMYWEIWKKLQQKYVEQNVKDSDLFYGSLQGMVAALNDPYSIFLPPQKAARFQQDLSGSFSGIGAELGMKKDIITIIAPLPDSPAERAGIKAGDNILAVDGKETYSWTLDEAVNKIRGPKGALVKLLILHSGKNTPREISIMRDTIVIKSVTWEMKNDNVAYIKISSFNEDTADLFDKAIRQLTLKNPRSLILDLRNDPGGFLDTAVRVASEWIPEGTIVEEKFSDGHVEKYVSNGKHRLMDLKTVVLVNQGSASASEIVAGALQDYGKGKIVGEKSFGKGSVQDYEQLPDGSGLKITVAEWLTPKGRHINKNGIEPDQKIAALNGNESVTSTPEIVAPENTPVDNVLDEVLKELK